MNTFCVLGYVINYLILCAGVVYFSFNGYKYSQGDPAYFIILTLGAILGAIFGTIPYFILLLFLLGCVQYWLYSLGKRVEIKRREEWMKG